MHIYISRSRTETFNGWSAEELADIDEANSMTALDEQTMAAIKAKYSNAEVELVNGNGLEYLRTYPQSDAVEMGVEDIMTTVYDGWKWLRDSESKEVQA